MLPRYNHTAVQFGSKLIILGGMNQNMTLEMSVQEFELNQPVVQERVKRERQERERERLAEELARRKKAMLQNASTAQFSCAGSSRFSKLMTQNTIHSNNGGPRRMTTIVGPMKKF